MTEPNRKFETERTRRFREQELNEGDERSISRIETFGCEVVQIQKTNTGPGWSYTLGVFDTCGEPEIIVVGLLEKTALFLLNEAARRLRQGVNLAEGRHREMIGSVECEFRPVDPKWASHLMGWATWYYGGEPFPVLQAVYPTSRIDFPKRLGSIRRFASRSFSRMCL